MAHEHLPYIGAILLLYTCCLAIYRLYFSPLAKFPGPKLAALTQWYEVYFDVLKGGQFMWELERMHKKYGPIVRINPFEIHIKDPDYYGTLYAGPTRKRDKDQWFIFIGLPLSTFSAASHKLHRERRSILSPFFSKKVVMEFEPVMHEKLQSLCQHFSRAIRSGQPLELHAAFLCFAADTVSTYTFGASHCFGYLDQQTLTDDWKKKVTGAFEVTLLGRHFPFLQTVGHLAPSPIVRLLSPCFTRFVGGEKQIQSAFREMYGANQQHATVDNKRKAILPSILSTDKIPSEEKRYGRLQDEATFLMIAGTDAPAQVLAYTMFHLHRNPEIGQGLRKELVAAFPHSDYKISLAALEQLPYLTAVIKEGLRIAAVVTTRLPRIAPDEVLQYGDWQIPPGTKISMSNHFILRDPTIFPDPLVFKPDRWMVPADEVRKLERYLVPFSKGPTSCLGPNMAYSWLYLVLGTIMRKFEFVLFETTDENIRIVRDCFNGQTKPGLNVIQVKVLRELA